MQWYHYFSGFLAGVLLANLVPHFVHGVSGNKFPTPFSTPHGRGLSSATVNVLWALFNLVIGYILFRVSKTSPDNPLSLIVFFIGVAVISIYSSIGFQKKHKE